MYKHRQYLGCGLQTDQAYEYLRLIYPIFRYIVEYIIVIIFKHKDIWHNHYALQTNSIIKTVIIWEIGFRIKIGCDWIITQ